MSRANVYIEEQLLCTIKNKPKIQLPPSNMVSDRSNQVLQSQSLLHLKVAFYLTGQPHIFGKSLDSAGIFVDGLWFL